MRINDSVSKKNTEGKLRGMRIIKRVFRRLTARYRALPDFIIIGEAKSGTTSLYKYLEEHPNVVAASNKEIGYFSDTNEVYGAGVNWYKSLFPLKIVLKIRTRLYGRTITGEASPHYASDPRAPARTWSVLPNVKLIYLVRDPVDRWYSHYRHNQRKGWENKGVEDAFKLEEKRLSVYLSGSRDVGAVSSFRRLSYIRRGQYLANLKKWLKYYSEDQILVMEAEELFKNPEKAFHKVVKFLKIQDVSVKFKRYNYHGEYNVEDQHITSELRDHFQKVNKGIEKYMS